MTERLDRIESLLEGTTQKLDRAIELQGKNAEGIDDLLGAVAATQADVHRLTVKSRDTDELFETLRAEAQADRQETRQLWNDAVSQMEADRARADERFKQADADRARADERFDRAIAQMEADRVRADERFNQIEDDRARADERFDRAIAQMEADRARADERHAAQMQVMQTLLLELTKTNGHVNSLRDRIDDLEAAG